MTTASIPRIRLPIPATLLVSLGAGFVVLGGFFLSPLKDAWSVGARVDETIVTNHCRDFFTCTLIDEIERTDKFLAKNKKKLPYTKDPRDIQPVSEAVRLNIDTQALGYLNLYKYTNKKQYRREAEDRLNHILEVSDQAYSQGSFDGQIGYSFLYAYELTGNQKYFQAGIAVADRCLTTPQKSMNGGYMCALNLGKAYRLTGNSPYLTASRYITRETSDKQFSDGAFPHRDSLAYGENTGYTSWLIFEMLHHRQDDVNNPDMDNAIIKAVDFLARRVNADGSLNYEDELGSYYADPGNLDGRGWLNDMGSMAFNMRSLGKNAEAEKLLTFLFKNQLKGKNAGSYPDKWMLIDPNVPITAGHPSILRTSLIFWYLTSIPLIQNSCQNGSQTSCVITPSNCNAAFEAMGLCQSDLPGHNVCIGGQPTKCTDEKLVQYKPSVCPVERQCTYNPDNDESDIVQCNNPGTRLCIGTACEAECRGVRVGDPTCSRSRELGDSCGSR